MHSAFYSSLTVPTRIRLPPFPLKVMRSKKNRRLINADHTLISSLFRWHVLIHANSRLGRFVAMIGWVFRAV